MRTRPVVSDGLLACAFLVWAVLEVVTGTVHGSVVVNTVAGVVSTGILAWRRRTPVLVALVCAGGLAAKTAWGLRLDGLALLSAMLVAAYSVGRHQPAKRAAVTVGAMLVLAWLSLFGLPPADRTVANYPFVALWICGPALAGAALRVQVERAARAADEAARADLEGDRRARSALLTERGRIARELHDTVAHAVSVMVLHVGAVRCRMPDGMTSESEALARAEDTGRRAIVELRRLLGVLRSDDLSGPAAATAPQPTLAGIEHLVEESRRTGLDVAFDVLGERPLLEPGIEVSLYRIVQEALTNVRKHARATSVRVRLRFGESWVRVSVADDGTGVSAEDLVRHGHGLVGVRERVEVYGGTLLVSASPSGGFVLEVTLPLTSTPTVAGAP